MHFRIIPILLLAAVLRVAPAQFETCVDINAPINASTGALGAQMQYTEIGKLKTNRVRVNCILGPWNSPSDSTTHSGATWFSRYDGIVNSLRAQGFEIYMLIGGQAVKSTFGFNTIQYCDQYASNFESIVNHFKDRVRVYESFNEPNDWAGGSTAQVEPRYFAYMLQEIYLNVKYRNSHWGNPDWQVTLVSGPLFTHDIGGTGDLGDTYFSSTATKGKNGDAAIPALNWNNVKTLTGLYPYDGIGYHIYVEQGSTNATAITNRVNLHLNSIMSAVDGVEGSGAHGKKIWISEVGWPSNSVGTEGQAKNLDLIFNLTRADSRVKMCCWFCLSDFDPANQLGVYTDSGLGTKKSAWHHLRWQSNIGSESGNKTRNASFETGASWWTTFGTTDGVQSGTWFGGIAARTGSAFWGAAANFGSKNGGVFQKFITSPGQVIGAGARIQTYREGGAFGDTACRVGVDPAGGENPDAVSVTWSDWLENPGAWRPISVRAAATGTLATVFLRHRQLAPVWNVTGFDDVVVIGPTASLPVQTSAFAVD